MILNRILAQKEREVALLRSSGPLEKALRGEIAFNPKGRFKRALSASPTLAVIAEIKRQSPSKGPIAEINDPLALAKSYQAGGASAISILTDKLFFNGDLRDLQAVAKGVPGHAPPLLRKEFIIDALQIAEAALAGASAVLLIVSVLGHKTKNLLAVTERLGLDALVEIHNEDELKMALDSGAEMIGINHRNLNTFHVDPSHSLSLLSTIPQGILTVAESGITTPNQARKYYQAGFHAVLIGEALVTSPCPKDFIRACQHG